MTLLQGSNSLEVMIRKLKKEVDKDSFGKEARLRAIPRAGERERQKHRLAGVRRRKREKILESRDSINDKSPWFKFVCEEGTYRKIIVPKKEKRQAQATKGIA